MIIKSEIEDIHNLLIERYGGLAGIRDDDSLSSAIDRPFQTFDAKELHLEIIHKAAALIESILSNHPFNDGNKRTGYLIMRLFLIKNGLDINASLSEKYDFVMRIASGKDDFFRIFKWLNKHTKSLKS
jgi:death-on-curing protein